ncbi:hypothetical protein [Thalassiella azotivora]
MAGAALVPSSWWVKGALLLVALAPEGVLLLQPNRRLRGFTSA